MANTVRHINVKGALLHSGKPGPSKPKKTEARSVIELSVPANANYPMSRRILHYRH
jgi:hypothetical protein